MRIVPADANFSAADIILYQVHSFSISFWSILTEPLKRRSALGTKVKDLSLSFGRRPGRQSPRSYTFEASWAIAIMSSSVSVGSPNTKIQLKSGQTSFKRTSCCFQNFLFGNDFVYYSLQPICSRFREQCDAATLSAGYCFYQFN